MGVCFKALVLPFIVSSLTLISCQDDGASSELQTRLRNGTSGLIEVRRGNATSWGGLCSRELTVNAATVACRSLGFRYGYLIQGDINSTRTWWWDSLSCAGDEASLKQCRHSAWGSQVNCSSKTLLAVSCYNTTVRFESDGTSPNKFGPIEFIDHNGRFYSICINGWDDRDAMVACREMGFQTGRSFNNLQMTGSAQREGNVWDPSLGDFGCHGNETRLQDCSYTPRTYNCNGGKATVACFANASDITENEVRLVDGGAKWGRVQLRYMGVWSTVCNFHLSEKFAGPVCRMLGFKNGSQIGRVRGDSSSVDNLPIAVLTSNCSGNETSVDKCPGYETGNNPLLHLCKSHGTDYFVHCHSDEGIQYRLAGPDWRNPPTFGRVEVRVDGEWGTVCNDRWNDSEATVLCKQMGFTDGVAYRDLQYPSPAAPPRVWLGGIECDAKYSSLARCLSSGWGVYNRSTSSFCSGHEHDASVACSTRTYGPSWPRLIGGSKPHYGRVETYSNFNWRQVCGTGFDDEEALVTCRELGYENAINMCCHAFGHLTFALSDGKAFKCFGNETQLSQCSTVPQTYCPGLPSNYASVYCYNDTLSIDVEIILKYKQTMSKNHTLGLVQVRFGDLVGHVCGDDFSEANANVTCQQLGMTGGVPYRYSETPEGPVLMSHVNCTGKEHRLKECQHRNWTTSYCSIAAGVLCYNKDPVKISLKPVLSNSSGFVQIHHSGEVGYICVSRLTSYEATVLCKQMGYVDGKPGYMRNNLTSSSSFFLRNVQCKGTETSIFTCLNDGWREDVGGGCNLPGYSVASVKCSGSVRLESVYQNNATEIGRVQVYHGNTWKNLCSDSFSDKEAKLVCSQVHYPYSQVVQPVYFANFMGYLPMTMTSANAICFGNETSISDCQVVEKVTCSVATVVCSTEPISNKTDVIFMDTAENVTYGMVSLVRYGYSGRACASDWDDKAANVACRQMGFIGGVMQKSRSFSRDINWLLNYKCLGNETNLSDCKTTGQSSNCVSSQITGAVCFRQNQTAPTFKLVNKNTPNAPNPNQGYVEISYNGVQGSICDLGWSKFDASVLCGQLGFYDGEALLGSAMGEGPPRRFLSNVDCLGKESQILECASSGWNISDPVCKTGRTAAVRCHDKVRLDLGENTGPVELNVNGRWGYICDDEWDEEDAVVTCRQMGFQHGRPSCCSLYGRRFYHSFVARKVQCNGNEAKLQECQMETSLYQTCSTGHYASVVCWNDGEEPQYGDVRFEADNASTDTTTASPRIPPLALPAEPSYAPLRKGRIQVEFGGVYGYICGSESWDDNAATVFCRQRGISKKGSAYRSASITSRSPFWITSFNCTGDEASLAKCQNTTWLDLSNCNQNYVAAAICIDDKIEFRLGGGNNVSYGRVEVGVDNDWGTVCDYHWSSQEADVICRHLGFHSGVAYTNSHYGPGTGKVWLFGLECDGDETSLTQCPHEGWDSLSNGYSNSWYCRGHYDDAGVYCYGHVRLQKGEDLNFGRLELLDAKDNSWYPVCDSGESDSFSDIACQQLGYVSGQAFCCSSLEKLSSMSKSLVNLTCDRNEKDIRNCSYTVDACPSKDYVSLLCSNVTASDKIPMSVSLENLNGVSYNGMVRVTVRGAFTGRICSKNWTDTAANVTCKMMGYAGGAAYQFRSQSHLPYVMGKVNCTGKEMSLEDCSYSAVGDYPGCDKSDHDAGVLCYNSSGITYSLSEGTFGVVNITVDGVVGHVCHLGWGDREARILCRQMGHVDGTAYVQDDNSYLGRKRWMTSLYCDGDEPSLFQCQDNGWDTVPYYCVSTTSVAAVYCYGKVKLHRPSYPTAKLPSAGAVVVYDQDTWNLICDEEWDAKDAKVACRSLGYKDGYPVCCSAYGLVTLKYSFTRFGCDGSEPSLEQCPNKTVRFSSIENTACQHASVVCLQEDKSQVTNYSLQLGRQSGSSDNTGKVMVRYASELGRICSDGWSDADAKVVCAELGYTLGQSYKHFDTYTDNLDNYGPWWTSNVKCTGNETKFGDCPKDDWGHVTKCQSTHAAGVLCYSYAEPAFRLSDTETLNYGLVQVSVDGEWGTICDINWDDKDARVFCRMMGYADGQPSSRYGRGTGPIWMSGLQCEGNETRLTDCVHTGWKRETRSSCIYHYRDAGVYCFKPVRLYDGTSASLQMQSRAGAMLFYSQSTDKWSLICDDRQGTPDLTARMACQEMNFVDGRALHSSAYGPLLDYDILNGTLRCAGGESKIEQCYTSLEGGCSSGLYMSIVCMESMIYNDTVYNITLSDGKETGIVNIEYVGQPGLICADEWDDADARVFCRSLGHGDGISYFHSIFGRTTSTATNIHMPYILSQFNCTGNETNLMACHHLNRTTITNCTARHAAGVFCFKDTSSDIEWRLVNGPTKEQGRVEMRLGGEWGTLCDAFWDDKDAKVLCHQLGYQDGEAFSGAKFGQGNGTVWISEIECKGDEDVLMKCPHRGFNTSASEGPVLRWDVEAVGPANWPSFKYCNQHKNDASVFCFSSVKLSKGANASYGAVQVYKDNQLYTVCDDHWTNKEAQVVCRALGFGDGLAIPRSGFGHLNGTPIGVKSVNCNGDEDSLLKCSLLWDKNCPSSMYASVYCSNTTILQSDPSLSLVEDDQSSPRHGIVQVRMKGLWGRMCNDNFGEKEANVTCRMLGYKGGVPYTHIASDDRPFTISNVSCKGNEASIFDCSYQMWGSPDVCKVMTSEAGVLCYNISGIQYRLAGKQSNESHGRVEIQYDGEWGTICNLAFGASDARVFCSALGYKDGQVITPNTFGQGSGPVWLETMSCMGNETTPLQCLSSGWNNSWESFSFYQCSGHTRDAAVRCYRSMMQLTQVRLVGGLSNNTGRVEVFVTEANRWGTVCDDGFDSKDAQVLCTMMGFTGGKVHSNTVYGEGTGDIWLDDLLCQGNETSITECDHPGLGNTNCFHFEDVAIECDLPGVIKPITTKVPLPTKVSLPPSTTLPQHLQTTSKAPTTRPNLPFSHETTTLGRTKPSKPSEESTTPAVSTMPAVSPTPAVSTTSRKTPSSTLKMTTTSVITHSSGTQSPTTPPSTVAANPKPSPPVTTATQTSSTTASSSQSSSPPPSTTQGALPAPRAQTNGGLIAAIVVPILIAIVTVIVLVLVCLKWRGKKLPRLAFSHIEEPPLSMTSPDTAYQYTNQLYNYLPSATDDDGLLMNNNEDAQLTQYEVPPAQDRVVDPLDVKLKSPTPACDDSQA